MRSGNGKRHEETSAGKGAQQGTMHETAPPRRVTNEQRHANRAMGNGALVRVRVIDC